jgi:hypothetical protein
MAITTIDGLIAAASQRVSIFKLASRTSVAAVNFSVFDQVGNPSAGVLAGTSTAAGIVPTSSTAGCPSINSFGGATGYINKIEFGSTVACRLALFDMVFKAGAYAFTAGTTTLSAQPSYSGRMLGGTDFTNTEIWIEVTTAFVTGTAWQVTVTYTNQSGTAGRSTVISAAQAAAGLTLGKMFQLPLQAGDTGVQKIESVIATNGGTAMTAGNFNVLVLRRLWSQGRVRVANDGGIHNTFDTGLPQIFDTSALILAVSADSTATGLPEVICEIVSG